jgi:hypothetical protein
VYWGYVSGLFIYRLETLQRNMGIVTGLRGDVRWADWFGGGEGVYMVWGEIQLGGRVRAYDFLGFLGGWWGGERFSGFWRRHSGGAIDEEGRRELESCSECFVEV